MEKIKEAITYLNGPDNVADFQKFCGVEVYTNNESNGSISEPESNGAVPQHGDTNKPADLNNLRQRVKNGYCKMNNGYINGVTNTELCKKGLNNTALKSKNGYVKNEIDVQFRQVALESTSQTKLFYRIRYKPIYYLFQLGASLGNEIFYLIFFPLLMWNLDSSLLRETAIVWHAGMYLGQALKDIIRRPRPSSPPAVPLEDRYVQEYGMPSTHAMVGAIIPFSLFIISVGRYQMLSVTYISQSIDFLAHLVRRTKYPFMIGLTLALSWTVVVGLSRIYLGMHSALDVICGLLTACVLMPCMLPFVGWFDHLQVTHPYAPMVTVLGSFMLCFVYPPLVQWSTARGDTATVHGIGSGISFGMWLNHYMGWMHAEPSGNDLFLIKFPTLDWFLLSLLRTTVGVVCLALLRFLLKKFLIASLCYLHNVDKNNIIGTRQKWFEVPQKFFTYFVMSVAAVFNIPALLSYLGVMREAFYTEY